MPSAASLSATIVGGGPAGLMAAEVLATAGVAVAIYDHKPSLGRKFLLAGRGGLNLTHTEPIADFLDRYGPARERLAAAVDLFGPDDLRAWCAALGQETFVGTSGRVFPEAFRATPLLRAWLSRLDSLGVEANLRYRWLGFGEHGQSRFSDPDGATVEVTSDITVLALGGASWPRVGSDGGWVDAITSAGIEVVALRPANGGVVIEWTDVFADRFAGSPLKNVAVHVGDRVVRGDPIVTNTGLEGGPIYAHSAALRGQLDAHGSAAINIDLRPDLTTAAMTTRLNKRRAKGSVATWLRGAGLSPVETSLLREATANTMPTTAEAAAELTKAVPVTVRDLAPIDRAISTAGGIALHEVDDTFMLVKLPGMFVAGEMLDWEAPTGGYLLQACFSTAVAAARGALAR